MYERFTDAARNAMRLANEEAQRSGDDYVNTEHVLLGVAQVKSGIAAMVLAEMQVSLDDLRAEVEVAVQMRPVDSTQRKQSTTPRAKRVIELAMGIARQSQAKWIGTESLLLGLLREREEEAAGILGRVNVTKEAVLAHAARIRGPEDRTAEIEGGQDPRGQSWVDFLPNVMVLAAVGMVLYYVIGLLF